MGFIGNYWIGLTDIYKKASGLEWTDLTPLDYQNWQPNDADSNLNNSTGKCGMIKRSDDAWITTKIYWANGSVYNVLVKVEEGQYSYYYTDRPSSPGMFTMDRFGSYLSNRYYNGSASGSYSA